MRVVNERKNGDYQATPVILERTPGKALRSLIHCEFGFGGTETNRSETSLAVRTLVMGCVDDTLIEGTPEEMVLFHTASDICKAARLLRGNLKETTAIKRAIKEIPKSFAESARAILVGANTAKVIGVMLLDIKDNDLLREVLKLPADEVLDLLELRVDNKATEEELLGLVA